MTGMNPNEAKIKNIIDMAFTFSAMTRVFEEGSDNKIKDKLETVLPQIASSEGEQGFRKRHDSFCRWFMDEIKTREHEPASYGQGAKVLDVALKVFVHYCHLPSPETAEKLRKWLNAAVDTKMLKYLKARPLAQASQVHATAIAQVDETTYKVLQRLVRGDICTKFARSILPVEWDDIMWRCLNKQ